jgi:16S rRNA processing protein RimM
VIEPTAVDYFTIGAIAGTHGLKGTARIKPFTDDPSRFELLDSVLLVNPKNENEQTLQLTSVAYSKGMVLVNFKGLNDINETEKYKGCLIKIPRDEALPLGDDEYYTADLYGMTVYDDEGAERGILHDILFTGANDVYIVKDGDGKEHLFPAIKECVLSVDIPNNKMVIKWSFMS